MNHRHIAAKRGLWHWPQTNGAEICPCEFILLARDYGNKVGYGASYSFHPSYGVGSSYCKLTEKNGAPFGISDSLTSEINPDSRANSTLLDSPSLNSAINSSFCNDVCSE